MAKMLCILGMFVLIMALGAGTAFAVGTASNQVPAVGLTVASADAISVDIKDTGGFAATAAKTVTLDGSALVVDPLVISADKLTATISAAIPGTLESGVHTVVVTVTNKSNAKTSITWTFTIADAALPSIGAVTPADGSTTSELSPQISAQVLNATSASFTIDGNLFDGIIANGVATPLIAPALTDGLHIVTVTAFDESDNSASLTWSFTVAHGGTATAMAGDCGRCHPSSGEKAANHISDSTTCGGTDCHSNDLLIAHSTLSCTDCHSSSDARVSDAIAAGDKSCTACHDNPHLALIDDQKVAVDASNPNQVCLSCHGVGNNSHGKIDGAAFDASVHANVMGPFETDANCVACHDEHSATKSILAYKGAAAADVDSLCYSCHGAGSGADMDAQTPAIIGSGMGTVGTITVSTLNGHSNINPGAHTDASKETLATFADPSTRHATCADCHNAHGAQAGLHTYGSSLAAPALYGATGVSIDYSNVVSVSQVGTQSLTLPNWGAPAASDYTMITIGETSNESQLCLKCHGAAGEPATGEVPAAKTSGTSTSYYRTDLAQDFNPYNASGHNVGQGRYTLVPGTSTTPTSYVFDAQGGMKDNPVFFDNNGAMHSGAWAHATNGWISGVPTPADGSIYDAQITCTDCHTSGSVDTAKGPHGAATNFMIDPAYPVDWTTETLGDASGNTAKWNECICSKCHPGTALYNAPGAAHTHSGGSGSFTSYTCNECHIAVPHGWKRPAMLVSSQLDSAPYLKATPAPGGYVARSWGVTAPTLSGTTLSYNQNNCNLGCDHNTGGLSTYMQ